MAYLLFILSLGLLVLGAEALVRGASRLAASLGVSSLIIALTVVSFATSAPELAVSMQATFTDKATIALSNIVGSNILNLLLVVGLSATIVPLSINNQVIRLDLPVMIGASILAWIFALSGTIHRLEGLTLVAILVGYLWLQIYIGRKKREQVTEPQTTASKPWLLHLLFIIFGLVLLLLSARLLVNSSVTIAQTLGVSDVVIGLTIVAIGTSMPEIATSLIAALRGERDIAIGAVVGSNIFNILCVLGITASLAPTHLPVDDQVAYIDMPIMLAVSLLALPLFFIGKVMSRLDGMLFFGLYFIYCCFLVLRATNSPLLHGLLF